MFELSEVELIFLSDGYYLFYEKLSGIVGDLFFWGDVYIKVIWVFVVCRFWFYLGCLGWKVIKYVFLGVV